MNWINSAGGPLICVETSLSSFWRGIDGNGLTDGTLGTEVNDYDRACAVSDYVGLVDLPGGCALILGDMPLATTVLCSSLKSLYIVRVFYMDPDANLSKLLEAYGGINFSDAIETIECEIKTSQMAIFDSAVPGSQIGEAKLTFEVSPGKYKILTKEFQLDTRTSVLIHKFEC